MNWINQKTLGLFVKTNGVLSNYLFGGLGHVFMLHRVLPEKLRNQYTINRDLAITPEYLEECIQYFIKKKYRFISLDELHHIIVSKEKQKQRFICFTLDDGYKDNLTYAFPLFKRYNIPFTIYVTNCFPNKTALLWWYWLEEIILTQKHFTLYLPETTTQFTWNNEKEELIAFHSIRSEIRKIPKKYFQDVLMNSFPKSREIIEKEMNEVALSWDEINQLSNEKIVTIGAHTMNHLSLTSLTEQEVRDEIKSSKEELEMKLSKIVNHFAYPYGGFEDAGKREYKIVEEIGFKTGTINFPGNIFYEKKKTTCFIAKNGTRKYDIKRKIRFYFKWNQSFFL